jgi:hypothetical protein
MNYIELLTGTSPDGGNGAAELIVLLALVAIIAAARRFFRGPRFAGAEDNSDIALGASSSK